MPYIINAYSGGSHPGFPPWYRNIDFRPSFAIESTVPVPP